MHKRLKLVILIGLIPLTLACSLTASPAAVISASQPTPHPSQAAPTAPSQPTTIKHPASPTPAGVACVVTAQALNVRTCPGVACPVSGWLRADDLVTVDLGPGGWAELQAGGYVNSSYLDCEGR